MRPPMRDPMRGRDGPATAGGTPARHNPSATRLNFPSFFLHLHLQEFLSASKLYGYPWVIRELV